MELIPFIGRVLSHIIVPVERYTNNLFVCTKLILMNLRFEYSSSERERLSMRSKHWTSKEQKIPSSKCSGFIRYSDGQNRLNVTTHSRKMARNYVLFRDKMSKIGATALPNPTCVTPCYY